MIKSLKVSQSRSSNLSEEITSELIARINIEKSDYRTILQDELEIEGYEIKEIENINEINWITFNDLIKTQKKINLTTDSRGIANAPTITESEAEILKNKESLKQTERYKIQKFKILQSLPEYVLTEDFVKHAMLKDKYRLINGINNYYLVHNPEIAKMLEHNQIIHQLTQVNHNGIFWSHDLRAKTIVTGKQVIVVDPVYKSIFIL